MVFTDALETKMDRIIELLENMSGELKEISQKLNKSKQKDESEKLKKIQKTLNRMDKKILADPPIDNT